MPSVGQYQRYISQGETKVIKLKESLSGLRADVKTLKRGTKPFLKMKSKIDDQAVLLKETQVKLKAHKSSLKEAERSLKKSTPKASASSPKAVKKAVAAKTVKKVASKVPVKKVAKEWVSAAPTKRGRPKKASAVEESSVRRGRPQKKEAPKVSRVKTKTSELTELEKTVSLLSIKLDALAELVSKTAVVSVSTAELRLIKRRR
jgi:hypothetical protein